MPQSSNYSPIIPLISTPRLDSYKVTFKTINDFDLYGVYIWAQHASASLYPIIQNLEITLRNAIDNEAQARFGTYWWNRISFAPGWQANLFLDSIQKAENKLTKSWDDLERKRLRIRGRGPLPTPPPVWSHDQIIAATEFSAWQFILVDAFKSPRPADNLQYLWPLSISRAFKNHAIINNSQNTVRGDLINAIKELRDYRNRLFHHEPIWTKDPSVVDPRTAINTIRNKINKIEILIKAIDTRKSDILHKVGLFSHARRICSENELSIYRYTPNIQKITQRTKRLLRGITCETRNKNITVTWQYANAIYGVYKIR